MKFFHSLLFFLTCSLSGLLSQVIVTDISTFDKNAGIYFYPDVNGKVLIDGDLYKQMKTDFKTEQVELFPNWPVQLTGSSQRGGIFCNLDDEPELEIIYNVNQQTYAWNVDGSLVTGWPVTNQLYPDGAPAFGDIDGDGEGEIVVSSRAAGTGNTGKLSAYEKDGSLVAGFPVNMTGGATKTPVLADLDGDDILEIIVEERDYPDGYVGVYKGDGSVFPGFPVSLDYIPASAVAVGDIDGDNIPEIVAESYYSIYAFDIYGNVLEGFPFTPGNNRVFSYSSPVLADLDDDGKREILAGDHSLSAGNGAVHVLHFDGSVFAGWPKYVGYWIYGPPAVADINGDGNLDVAIGDQVLSPTPSNKVYAWDKNGVYLPGWPTSNINSINNQIIIADLDEDNQVELMWDDNTNAGIYLGYNHDGTPMEGWPLPVTGTSFFMNPFVTDINGDGILDISGASQDMNTGECFFYLWNANVPVNDDLAILPVLQYNVQHDGVYRDNNMFNADFIGIPLEICQGANVQFTDQSTGNIISWDWSFEGGNPSVSSSQNPLVNYETSGEYNVTLTISDGTQSQTIEKTNYISVDDDPQIPAQPVGPDFVTTSVTPYTFYETSCQNADDYIWELIPENVGVLLPADTNTKIKIYWSQAANYSAVLKVKSVNACGDSEFSEMLTIYVNWESGVLSQQVNDIEIFPNPTSGILFINLKENTTLNNLALSNITGKIFISNDLITRHNNMVSMDLNGLPDGIYFLTVQTTEINMIRKFLLIR
jgi:PKD repeat protein